MRLLLQRFALFFKGWHTACILYMACDADEKAEQTRCRHNSKLSAQSIGLKTAPDLATKPCAGAARLEPPK